MKTVIFYDIATHLLGSLPDSLLWLYDVLTVVLVICTFLVFIIPISLLFRKVVNGL